MHTLSGRQLLTCRYWAFGPRCPDIDGSGVQTCRYAHWDTNRLADFYEQRGTCYEWFYKRFCPFGLNCSYEHRDTGVLGLSQGTLVLHGLNLEIANAANRSGFNTRNQVALMDLIWSVRRIAFRHAVERPKIQRPPKHPIYPDRYRPSDPSDNTNRLRKRAREPEGRGTDTGTAPNPIDVDGDDMEGNGGGAAANSSAKRMKVTIRQICRHKVEPPTAPKILHPVYPAKLARFFNNHQDRGRTTACRTTYMPSPRSLNPPPPRPSSVRPIFNHPRPLVVPKPRDMTVVELQRIGNILKDNMEAVVECGNVMKTMYNRDDRLGDDIVYQELEQLKGKFDGCVANAEVGIKTVQKIITLIENSKDEVISLV